MKKKHLDIPPGKKFFKLSELAGKRWPKVTEEQIFDWHDENITISPELFFNNSTLPDNTLDYWYALPHYGKINRLAFWIFLPKLRAFDFESQKKQFHAKVID